jgi:hypothetical protein
MSETGQSRKRRGLDKVEPAIRKGHRARNYPENHGRIQVLPRRLETEC